jgi:hypothetical protein
MTAAFQCTFNSANLSQTVRLISPTAELRDWIEHNFNLKDLKFTLNARNSPGALTDLTYPLNDPQKEKLEPYKFTYPSAGLMHWGECLVLINGNDLAAMQNIQQGTFILQSSPSNTLTFQNMFLVATIPICELGENQSGGRIGPSLPNDSKTLHLGLLVDERWFIANYSRSYYANLGCQGSWADLINSLLNDSFNTCLSPDTYTLPTPPAISSAYGVPSLFSDLIELGEYPSGQLLESVLLNCGLMLVRYPNGNYEIQTYQASNTIESGTTYSQYVLRSGGDWNRWGRNNWTGALPAQVCIHFPYWDETFYNPGPETAFGPPPLTVYPPDGAPDDAFAGAWMDQWYGDQIYHLRSPLDVINYFTITVNKSLAYSHNGLPQPTGNAFGQKVFRETARAMGRPPQNVGQLSALATQIAADFYNRKYWSLWHETWNLLIPPSGSGWFTYVYEYHDRDCCTRILGDYLNHDVEQLMHDFCEVSEESEESEESAESEESEEPEESEESEEISEEPVSAETCVQVSPSSQFPGYMPGVKQVIGKDTNNCWHWYTLGSCNGDDSTE